MSVPMIISADEETGTHIDILPDELMINIFKFLPLEAILECENVSNRWRKLVQDAALWKRIQFVCSGKPGQSELSQRNLGIIETHRHCIRCLRLHYIYNYAVIKSIIQDCHNLMSLELVMCRISTDFQEDIFNWPNLRKISLKNSIMIASNADLTIRFDNFKQLRYLALADFGLPIPTRDSLLSCNYLTHIFIEKVKNLDLEFVHNLIRSKMDIVEALNIYGGQSVNDETLLLMSQCKSLKDLAIIRCEGLTDAGLINLVNLKEIQHLQIWNNSKFTEINLRRTLASPALVKLRSLSLSRIANISPLIVDVISEYYKDLKFLAVYQCPRIISTDYEKQLKLKFRNIDVVLY